MRLKDVLFWLSLLFAILVALAIGPGIDLGLWHFLHPVTFWQKFVVVGLEIVTAVPRAVCAFLVSVGIAKTGAEIFG